MRHRNPARLLARSRDGFTLVELLVAIGILIILTTMSVAVYTTTASADRIRSSARQVQSSIGGARDRGLKAWKENPLARRGLRLIVDSTDPTTVTSFVYIGNEDYWTDGMVLVGRPDFTGPANNPGSPPDGYADNNVIRTVRGYGTGWRNLYQQGLLVSGARMQVPAGNDAAWYTVDTSLLASSSSDGPDILLLKSDYRTAPVIPINPPPPPTPASPTGADGQPGIKNADDDGNGTVDDIWELGAVNSDDTTDVNAFGNTGMPYQLELQSTILPNQEPLRLSSGIAIDLYNSSIPPGWYQQVSLAKGSPAPATNYDQNGNYNGWGIWSVEGTDSTNAANDIYRQYSPRMDIMFSPHGTVSGSTAAFGPIHFRLAETEDIALARLPSDPQAGTMLYCSLFPLTGYVGTFRVNPTGDPLYYAKIGAVAGR